jgi:hypothetical protein
MAAKRKVPQAFLRAVAAHRERLEKVATVQAAAKMKKLYDKAQEELVARIARTAKLGKGDTFTAHQQRIVIAQLRQGQALIAKKLAGDMTPLSKAAQEASLKGLVEDISKLHKAFTGSEISLPTDEARVFAGVVAQRQPSLIRMHQSSMQRYGVGVAQKVEQKLALGLIQGDTPQDVYQDVTDTIDGEWYQGERIVRTELAYAFNATHADGIKENANQLPELMQRWEEQCDDNGEPLDDRVGVDSIALHGQVAPPGGVFTMPATAPRPDAKGNTKVSLSLVGLSWDFPPNRPNDRAVLSPWMPDWGIPGWRYSNGKRIPL